MNIHFNRLTAKYKKETIDIFNYYAEIRQEHRNSIYV